MSDPTTQNTSEFTAMCIRSVSPPSPVNQFRASPIIVNEASITTVRMTRVEPQNDPPTFSTELGAVDGLQVEVNSHGYVCWSGVPRFVSPSIVVKFIWRFADSTKTYTIELELTKTDALSTIDPVIGMCVGLHGAPTLSFPRADPSTRDVADGLISPKVAFDTSAEIADIFSGTGK